MTPQEFLKKDRFADNVGVELVKIKEGYGKARLVIMKEHLNADDRIQGGVLFMLADPALAAATNPHGTLTFSLSSNITFLCSSDPEDTLYAEARGRHTGRSTGYYQIDITNQKGELVVTSESSVFRKGDALSFVAPLQEGRDYFFITDVIGQRFPLAPLRKAFVEPKFRYISKHMGRWLLSSEIKKVITSFSLPFLYSTEENIRQ